VTCELLLCRLHMEQLALRRTLYMELACSLNPRHCQRRSTVAVRPSEPGYYTSTSLFAVDDHRGSLRSGQEREPFFRKKALQTRQAYQIISSKQTVCNQAAEIYATLSQIFSASSWIPVFESITSSRTAWSRFTVNWSSLTAIM